MGPEASRKAIGCWQDTRVLSVNRIISARYILQTFKIYICGLFLFVKFSPNNKKKNPRALSSTCMSS